MIACCSSPDLKNCCDAKKRHRIMPDCLKFVWLDEAKHGAVALYIIRCRVAIGPTIYSGGLKFGGRTNRAETTNFSAPNVRNPMPPAG